MTTPKLILYIGGTCGFCARVTQYIQSHPIDIEIKDVWEDEAAAKELQTLTNRTQVPCLKIGDDYMFESLDIIEKLKTLQTK
jgi:glutaredoxin